MFRNATFFKYQAISFCCPLHNSLLHSPRLVYLSHNMFARRRFSLLCRTCLVFQMFAFKINTDNIFLYNTERVLTVRCKHIKKRSVLLAKRWRFSDSLSLMAIKRARLNQTSHSYATTFFLSSVSLYRTVRKTNFDSYKTLLWGLLNLFSCHSNLSSLWHVQRAI